LYQWVEGSTVIPEFGLSALWLVVGNPGVLV